MDRSFGNYVYKSHQNDDCSLDIFIYHSRCDQFAWAAKIKTHRTLHNRSLPSYNIRSHRYRSIRGKYHKTGNRRFTPGRCANIRKISACPYGYIGRSYPGKSGGGYGKRGNIATHRFFVVFRYEYLKNGRREGEAPCKFLCGLRRNILYIDRDYNEIYTYRSFRSAFSHHCAKRRWHCPAAYIAYRLRSAWLSFAWTRYLRSVAQIFG